ncbi:MAG: glycosyltransferase family 4 protein [Planctomycetes bacterium]|nr:glycosyltransferase family 4 protein [Planctomycetota bacterium]
MSRGAGEMRVGLDAREAFRENPRGIGLYARHLLREFAGLAPELRILAYHERPAPPDLPPLGPAQTPRRVTMRGARLHLWERLALPLALHRDRPHVYHGTYNTLPPRWPLLRTPPLVVSLHDVIVTWFDEDLHDPYVRYCRRVTPRVVRDAARILTVSEWSRTDILERFGADPAKVVVFHNGIHPDFLAGAPEGAAARGHAACAGGRPYLFCPAAPLPRKNVAPLLRALGLLHARGRLDHEVVLSGLAEAQRAPFAAAAQEAGIAARVRFLPYVTRTQLIELYAGADLAIYPSLLEGWGIPVIEALALGTPVATSNTSGMAEAAGAHATLFDPRSIESMAAGVARALEGRETFLRSTRAAAVARARGFTWRKAAETTLRVYREVAG